MLSCPHSEAHWEELMPKKHMERNISHLTANTVAIVLGEQSRVFRLVIILNLPPNGTPGFARHSVNALSLEPLPPARTIATVLAVRWLILRSICFFGINSSQ